MNRQVRIWLAWTFVIGLSLGVGGSALAQESESQGAPKTIEAISVTAEKREIDLQETGLSIQAFSSGDIDRSGMAKSEDIGGFTPGFQFIPATGSNSQVAFAGRGSVRTDNHPINEQSAPSVSSARSPSRSSAAAPQWVSDRIATSAQTRCSTSR
jgi:outer membrane receptor protein involved in Fe transport